MAALLPVAPARAAIIQVGCGDAHGLREAVRAANARPGFDGIILKDCTYKFLSPEPFHDAALVVTDDLAIYGNGAEIVRSSKAADLRHFDLVGAGTELELDSLTLAYGKVDSAYATLPAAGSVLVGPGAALVGTKLTVQDNAVRATVQGGPVLAAGGILNDGGEVLLRKSTLKRNTATVAAAPGATLGGGLASVGAGPVTLYKTVVKANQVRSLGVSGRHVLGGGLAAVDGAGVVVVERSTVTGNRAVAEGGMAASGAGGLAVAGTTTIETSEIRDNEGKAKSVPGAAMAGGVNNGGTLTVDAGSDDQYDRTEIVDNLVSCTGESCLAAGGGYRQDAPGASGTFTYTALKDNEAKAPDGAAFGGGLYAGGGTVSLAEAIVKRNEVEGDLERGGGIFLGPGGAVEIGVSDVYDNEPDDCYGVPAC